MKKIYLLATALAFSLSANAQLTDGFEDYPLGPYFGGHWTNWSGVDIPAENIIVTNEQASEGTQAGFVGGDEIQDGILNVGMKTSGVWTYSMDVYIEFGASGYFNAQHDLNALGVDGNWAYQAYIGLDPTDATLPPSPGTFAFATGGTAYTFPYPEDQWFNFAVEHDLDLNLVRIYMDGVELTFGQDLPFGSDPNFQGKLNGFDYYSASPVNIMFIDNIKFYAGALGVNDLTSASISVYPTVAKDIVNVTAKSNITNVAVYNTAGQQVMRVNPNGMNAQINVNSLPAGVYIMKIQSGKETLSKKIVVK